MEAVWYYAVNGAQNGPFSWDELKQAAAAGKFSPGDLVWKEGTPDWVAARTVADLFPATPPAPPRSAPPPLGTYAVSPPTPSQTTTSAPASPPAEPLSLDDEPGRPAKKPRRERERERDANAPPQPMPEWVKLIQLFVLRTFNPDPSQATPKPDEEAALTRSGVMDLTARKFAVWRRSVLFVSAVPCAFAALFGLINVMATDESQKDGMSAFGMFVFYIQAFALFALPVAAVFGALAYDRLAVSTKWVLIGGLVSFGVPLLVAFVPGSWLIDLKTTSTTTVGEIEAAQSLLGIALGIQFYLILMPAVLSLLPAVSRACVRMKLMLPESLVPGWGLVTSIPLCVLLTLATFVLLYHMVGNALLIIGLLLWVAAPLLYLSKFDLLTRPVTAAESKAALAKLSLVVVGIIALGMLFLFIFLFTAKFGGKTLMGFDKSTSLARPWNLELHKTWIEYLGRSLFLSVFFADLLLRIAISVWREERAFAGSPETAGFDNTMSGLSSAVLPRGSVPPPAA